MGKGTQLPKTNPRKNRPGLGLVGGNGSVREGGGDIFWGGWWGGATPNELKHPRWTGRRGVFEPTTSHFWKKKHQQAGPLARPGISNKRRESLKGSRPKGHSTTNKNRCGRPLWGKKKKGGEVNGVTKAPRNRRGMQKRGEKTIGRNSLSSQPRSASGGGRTRKHGGHWLRKGNHATNVHEKR